MDGTKSREEEETTEHYFGLNCIIFHSFLPCNKLSTINEQRLALLVIDYLLLTKYIDFFCFLSFCFSVFYSWDVGFLFFGGGDLGEASGASGDKVVISGKNWERFRLVLVSVSYSVSLLSIMARKAAFSVSRSSRACRRSESSVRRSRLITLFRLNVAWRQWRARLVVALFCKTWIALL